ncbi:MAG: hypothetical protein WCY23_03935 [Candidatus Omnitrophota bacterium]
MKPLHFYEHFACGYGTMWLALSFASLITRLHFNIGWFGFIVLLIIALIYAFIRKSNKENRSNIMAQITKEDVRRHLKRALRIDLSLTGILLIGYLAWILYNNWINQFPMIFGISLMTDLYDFVFFPLSRDFLILYVPCILVSIGIEWYKSLPEKK